MIKSIKVTNRFKEEVTLYPDIPEASGFAITNIDGLGPANANIISIEAATKDGSYYNSGRLNNRNIVMHLQYYGNDIEALRINSYRFFPVKSIVDLEIETDYKKVKCSGIIESNEPNIFSSDVSTIISIICPDPYMYDLDDINLTGLTNGPTNVTYNGEYDTGLVITLRPTGPITKFYISNLANSSAIYFNDYFNTQNGDVITIDTRQGSKSIYLTRSGQTSNIMRSIERSSNWVTLTKGSNIMNFGVNVGGSGAANIHADLTFKNKYGGV